MNAEQQLLQNWRSLSLAKQQEVLKFVEYLSQQEKSPKNKLEQDLRKIRAKIVASSETLLDREQIEKEIIERRGELQEN